MFSLHIFSPTLQSYTLTVSCGDLPGKKEKRERKKKKLKTTFIFIICFTYRWDY